MALDPSQSMLEICRERAKAAGILERREFFHGYVKDLLPKVEFEAALSILVAHFIKRDERIGSQFKL